MTTETKKYLVKRANKQEYHMEIPAAWKVTFGAMMPGAKGGWQNPGQGWTLRVYEAKEKQRVVLTDVIEFRDLSVPFELAEIAVGAAPEGLVGQLKQISQLYHPPKKNEFEEMFEAKAADI